MTLLTNLPIYQSTNLPPTNPYVGPRTFSYEQRHLFFGREREARDLLARVLSERLLLFYAQSGAGKSSLINTRLIPALQEKDFVVLPVARVSGELPAGVERVDNIFAFNLMLSIVEDCDPALLAGVTLSDFLARLARRTVVGGDGRERKIWLYDAEQAPATGGSQRYALIVDQFEEIITTHPGRWREREAFFRQLDAAMQADPNLWVVLTLREDYVAALDPYAPLLADRLRARYLMEHMKAEAALDAVRRPAELAGRPFAPGVAEKLVDDLRQIRVPGQESTVAGEYVQAVQLEVVCFQLWEELSKREAREGEEGKEGEQITLEDLAAAGDVNRALTQFYEETLAVALTNPAAEGVSERQLRTWFDQELITPAGTRGLVIQSASGAGGLPNGVVDILQRSFLVHAETRGGDVWIELVHDRFVEPIRASNAAWFPVHLSALQRQAALWDEQGRSSGLLLRDAALIEAEAWAAAQDAPLEPHELDFLEACHEVERITERDRRQSRRIRVLAAVAAAVAILALLAATIALDRTRKADLAKQEAVHAQTAAEESAGEADQQRQAAEEQRVTAEREKARAELSATEAQRQARIAFLQRLGAQSQLNLESNHDLALLLSLEADGGEIDTVEVGGNLVDTLEHSPQVQFFLRGHDAPVISLAFDASGRRLASGDMDGKLILWDLTTYPPTPTALDGPSQPIRALAFAPQHDALVSLGFTAYGDGTTEAFVWSAKNGAKIRQLSIPPGDPTGRATLSPDGGTIALLSNRTTIGLWNVFEDAPIGQATTIAEPSVYSGVHALAFSPDATKLALFLSAEDDAGIVLWDVAEQRIVAGPRTEHSTVSVLKFSPDGELLASSSADGRTYLWDVEDGELIYKLPQARGWPFFDDVGRGLAFSHDSQTLVTGDHQGIVSFWDAANLQPPYRSLQGRSDEVLSVSFSPDGRQLAAGGEDGAIVLYDLSAQNRIGEELVDFRPSLIRWALSPDGATIAASSISGAISLLDSNSGEPTGQPLAGHSSVIYDVAFHPTRPLAASTATEHLDAIEIATWDLLRREPKSEPIRPPGYVGSNLRLSSTDNYLAYIGWEDGSIHLYATDSLSPTGSLKPPPDDGYRDIAFGTNSSVLAAGTIGGLVELWDVGTLQRIWQQGNGDSYPVTGLSFSPDQATLAVGESSGRIALLDATTGETITTLGESGNQNGVRQVVFSPDGAMLASSGEDNTIVLWDIASGTRIARFLTPYINGVEKLAISPDGKTLFSSGDGVLTRWNVQVEQWRAWACEIAGRNLSTVEWKRYIGADTPYGLTCPDLPPHPSVLRDAIDSAVQLAEIGRTDEALKKIEEALAYSRNLEADASLEAQRILDTELAAHLVKQGARLAQQGDLAGATDKFMEAIAKNPDIDIDPDTEPKRIYAVTLLNEAMEVAQNGDIFTAEKRFREALALDGGLETDNQTAPVWGEICWQGIIWNEAALVLDACNIVVSLAPEGADYLESRGVARALVGDSAGAVEDLEAAIALWTRDSYPSTFIEVRRVWVEALKAGRNPFDAETLELLRQGAFGVG